MPSFGSRFWPSTRPPTVVEQPTPVTTAAVAARAATLLDKVKSELGSYLHRPGATASLLQKHTAEISNIRNLLVKIQFQDDLQTPQVGVALATVKGVIDKLVQTTHGGAGSLEQLNDVMEELAQAAKNLRQRLPGDVFLATENKARRGFQNNAAIGGERPDRVVGEALRNDAEDAMQVNAPIYGDPSFLAGIAARWGGGKA